MAKVKFKTVKAARIYQRSFKKKYGYVPSLFKVGNKSLFIEKPRGLRRIDIY